MPWPKPAWFDALPVGPAYDLNYPLANETTIKVGGPAQVWAPVENWAQVSALMAFAKAQGVALTSLGKGSNMVVRDAGIEGIVMPIAKGCDAVRTEGTTLYAESGAASGTAARAAREAELEGLAFLGGIPGAIGGALMMNAGAYGGETFRDLIEVTLLDDEGHEVIKPASFVQPRYRGTTLPKGWLYKAAKWQLRKGDKALIKEQMREVNHKRSTSQPLHMPSSGSWFKNVNVTPENVQVLQTIWPDATVGGLVNAWRVVDAAGCRGWQEGGAQVSEQHCNFFVNTGGATCEQMDDLSKRVEAQALKKLGITLEREVKFTGAERA